MNKKLSISMKCGNRALSLTSLALGLLALGTLSLAVATDYWLFTHEPYIPKDLPKNDTQILNVNMHSGLWRFCLFDEFGGECALLYQPISLCDLQLHIPVPLECITKTL